MIITNLSLSFDTLILADRSDSFYPMSRIFDNGMITMGALSEIDLSLVRLDRT